MNDDEKRLSDYIDSLNEERKPKEHENKIKTPEMEQLFETVRLVRGLKEPSLPKEEYPRELASTLNDRVAEKRGLRNSITKPKRNWLLGVASLAAVFALFVIVNLIAPFGETNIVYAMEKAFQEVKAYHGVLDIVETNAEGDSTIQAKVEVWADKEGQYYVKQLEGAQKDVITVNDGQKKWQVQPEQKQVNIFPAFPDPYSFTFELGTEIAEIKNAVQTKVIGDDNVAGRAAVILEVTPQGGSPYKIWIDKETKMPLQKQFAIRNAIQYKVSYTEIDFSEAIPKELLAYSIPKGFEEINQDPEQLVSTIEEAQGIAGFTPKMPQNTPASYAQTSISVGNKMKVVKTDYTSEDHTKQIVVLQSKAKGDFEPASMAILGKVDGNIAEIQVPIQAGEGILGGSGPYAGVTGINSIRWQQDGIEYAVVGNVSVEELGLFIKSLTKGTLELSSPEKVSFKPQIEVPVDLKVEESDQKNADAGSSPWKLDPAFVAQVFVSLKIYPAGIQDEYPIKMEELKIVQNTGVDAVVELNKDNSNIERVYLKRLVRQDSTGIWTVVGYDLAD